MKKNKVIIAFAVDFVLFLVVRYLLVPRIFLRTQAFQIPEIDENESHKY